MKFFNMPNHSSSHPTPWSGFLRRLREERELTQSHVAKLVGTTQTSVSRWEAREDEPNKKNLRRLAEVYGLSQEQYQHMIAMD